jgi:hypothetical protein
MGLLKTFVLFVSKFHLLAAHANATVPENLARFVIDLLSNPAMDYKCRHSLLDLRGRSLTSRTLTQGNLL